MTKPRLSMKLLWRFSTEYVNAAYKGGHGSGVVAVANEVGKFLDFVDMQMKSNGHTAPKKDKEQ